MSIELQKTNHNYLYPSDPGTSHIQDKACQIVIRLIKEKTIPIQVWQSFPTRYRYITREDSEWVSRQ